MTATCIMKSFRYEFWSRSDSILFVIAFFIILIHFQSYDPFFEYLDTPTLLGTSIVNLKPFAYMTSSKSDFKVIDLRNKEVGTLYVEIWPCKQNGSLITDKDGMSVKKPKKDLLGKSLNFIIKIGSFKHKYQNYEVIKKIMFTLHHSFIFESLTIELNLKKRFYCQFKIPGEETFYTSETIEEGKSEIDFKFSRQFTYTATAEVTWVVDYFVVGEIIDDYSFFSLFNSF